MPLETVVNTTGCVDDSILLKAFLYLLENSKNIKNHMENFMPIYINRLEKVKNLCEIN